MSKIVVLGAGIGGHTAVAHLRRKLSKEHEVLVVSPIVAGGHGARDKEAYR